MKTFRIALTAAMLLSLHATYFCMELTDKPTLARTLSHDGTRKVLTGYSGGMFGSGIDTLNKLGQEYAPGYVYALGSDDQAQSRWENVAKNNIKTVEHAIKYIAAAKAKGWNISEEALQPLHDVLKTDFENKNKAIASFVTALHAKAQKDVKDKDVEFLKELVNSAKESQQTYNTHFPHQAIAKSDLNLKTAKYMNEKNIHEYIKNFMAK